MPDSQRPEDSFVDSTEAAAQDQTSQPLVQYVTGGSGYIQVHIERMQVERLTDSSVWIRGRRYARRSEYGNYFDTWEEAHAYLLDAAQAKVDRAQQQLARANADYSNVKDLMPPAARAALAKALGGEAK